MTSFAADDILPAAPDGLEVLHDREYRVRAFRLATDRLLVLGAVRDQKPPGLYIPDDPAPLTIHHMQVGLQVSFPDLEIVDVEVHFESHPRNACPTITEHYGDIVGLSIARGFTHEVRALFGGPRGCTHTTALLQAMAPVAVQCFWSMHHAEARARGDAASDRFRGPDEDEGNWRRNLNTCHVWDEDGELVTALRAGEPTEAMPLFLRGRLAELGIEPGGD